MALSNLILLILLLQGAMGHGDGGNIEKTVDNYSIDLRFSEDPLNSYEPVFFILTLRNGTEQVDFGSVQLEISNDKKTLVRASLSPEFEGQSDFVFKFPSGGGYAAEVKFNNGLETLVKAGFDLEVEGSKETNNAVEAEGTLIEVLITDDGFQPKKITIQKGTTVTFKNAGKNFHWPASDFHPTHSLYPTEKSGCLGSNFDACKGLASGKAYPFTFDKVGSWTAHDHLYPGLTMQIDVVDASAMSKPSIISKAINAVLGLFHPTKSTRGINELIPSNKFLRLSVAEQRGYMEKISSEDSEAAWKYLKEAFIVDNLVIGNAHELAHIVGNAIYKEFGIEGVIKCDPAFSFGCYHGVTEKLLSESGRSVIKKVEEQCMQLFPSDKGGESPSCIHGTGHGLLTLNALDIKQALNDCDELSINSRHYCYDGVFMENLFSNPDSKMNLENPWAFCENFDQKYHASCATYLISNVFRALGDDVDRLAATCQNASNIVLQENCIRSLGLRIGQITQGNPDLIKERCYEISSKELRDTCIIFAATETVFQDYAGWQQSYRALCNLLDDSASKICFAQLGQIIKDYNRDDYQDNGKAYSQESGTAQVQNTNTLGPETPEIREIKKLRSPSEGKDVYRKLIERIGPIKAQETLYRSGLPFTGETHLLNHASGEFLYEKFGASGLPMCRDYFLSSCYHGFIIDLIAEEGFDGINTALDECRKQGPTTLSQCMHAMGHGFVSWMGYERLDDAVKICDQIASGTADAYTFNCYDGAFMENVWGVHDGFPSLDRWIDENDPLYPCYDERIDPKFRTACIGNAMPLMLAFFNGSLKKSGELCLTLDNISEKKSCFNGLSRQIHPMTFGNNDKVFELCRLMPEQWSDLCLMDIAVSDISVGGRELAAEICNSVKDGLSGECFSRTINSLTAYEQDPVKFEDFCSKIYDEKFKSSCMARLPAKI